MESIPCPVCHGSGEYHDYDTFNVDSVYVCTACRGSGKMPMTQANLERRERELALFKDKPHQPYRQRRAFDPRELEIIGAMKSYKQTVIDLRAEGFYRSTRSIQQQRHNIKHNIRPRRLTK